MPQFSRPIDPELQTRADGIEAALKRWNFKVIPIISKGIPWLRIVTATPTAIKIGHELDKLEVLIPKGKQLDFEFELALGVAHNFVIRECEADDEACEVLDSKLEDLPISALMIEDTAEGRLAQTELLFEALERRKNLWRSLAIVMSIWCVFILASFAFVTLKLSSQLNEDQTQIRELAVMNHCRAHPIQRTELADGIQAVLSECGNGTFLVEVWEVGFSSYDFAFTTIGKPLRLLGQDATVMPCGPDPKPQIGACG